jgi:chromosome segregation ATPase
MTTFLEITRRPSSLVTRLLYRWALVEKAADEQKIREEFECFIKESTHRLDHFQEQLFQSKSAFNEAATEIEVVKAEKQKMLVEKAADEQKIREEFDCFKKESAHHLNHFEEQLFQTKSAFNEAATELEVVKAEKQKMKNELEERVVDLEKQVATFSMRCDELMQENAINKHVFNDNATHLQINIDILFEEKVNSDHKAIESAQRILDLEQQLSTSSVKFSELSLDYNRKAQAYDDAIARLEDNLAEKATLMSELEALAAQSSEKYAKFSLDYTTESETKPSPVKKPSPQKPSP